MSKISDFFKRVKGWGFTALLALFLFIGALITGWTFIAGVSLGVFLTRNWDIIVEYVTKQF